MVRGSRRRAVGASCNGDEFADGATRCHTMQRLRQNSDGCARRPTVRSVAVWMSGSVSNATPARSESMRSSSEADQIIVSRLLKSCATLSTSQTLSSSRGYPASPVRRGHHRRGYAVRALAWSVAPPVARWKLRQATAVQASPSLRSTAGGGPSHLASGTLPTYCRSFIPASEV